MVALCIYLSSSDKETASTNIALHQQGSVSLNHLWRYFKMLLQKGQTIMKIQLEFEASIQYWRAKSPRQLGWRSPCTKMQRKGAHPQGFCWVLANRGMLCFTCRNLGRSYLPSFCYKVENSPLKQLEPFLPFYRHYTTSIRQEIKLGKAGSYCLPWLYVVMEYCTGGICIHRLLLWPFRSHFFKQQGEEVFVLSSSR